MTMAYKHINRSYCERFKQPKVFDSKKIFGIPSAVGSFGQQPTTGNE